MLLIQNAFGFVLSSKLNSDFVDVNQLKTDFKNRLTLQFDPEWQTSINESKICILYRHLKDEFKLESYLLSIPCKICKYILKFRLCNHKLSIEKGRYAGKEGRLCKTCKMNFLGDEYHLIFKCNNS